MLFESINLPLPVLLHAIGLTALGLFMVFEKPQRPGEDRSVLGIATTGLGLSYLTTSYVPISQNQFLYASAPVRIGLGVLAAMKVLLTRGQNPALYPGRSNLLGICIYDALGGAWVAYAYLDGSLSGRVPTL